MKSRIRFAIFTIVSLVYFGILAYLFIKWKNEDRLFYDIVSDIRLENPGVTEHEDSLIIVSMDAVNSILHRNGILSMNKADNFNSSFIESSESELEYVRGACGSYSMVLARVLITEGFRVRIGQMLYDGHHANHIIVEARMSNGKWVVLDPFYNLYFRSRDGSLAGFAEVSSNWEYYKEQTPPDYYHEYTYKALRYTNWERFSFAGKAVRNILNWTIGPKRTAEFSLRPYILNKYRIFFFAVMIFYFPFIIFVLFVRKFFLKRVLKKSYA
jgi:hypothetical protein